MKFTKLFFIFLIINFSVLGLGRWIMGEGARGNWYLSLNKAPWTPDGWVFGAAWTTIMICFSFYMTYLYLKKPSREVLSLFILQFVLNLSWNLVFFNLEYIYIGLINIMIQTIIIATFLIIYMKALKGKTIFILPYLIWICIATSLNLYIVIYN